MNILLCMDSWKGSLSAVEACEAVAAGIHSVFADCVVNFVPLADGGEGTLALVALAHPGEMQSLQVQGPLSGQQIDAGYLWWPDRQAALMEMALCAGLPLLTESQRNPLLTTTFGVGQWMKDAVEKGAKEIILTLGGSATVDGGVGMAQAMGWQFLDDQGNELEWGGGALIHLAKILPPVKRSEVKVRAMCDVTNPLLGEKGAATVFGPQKGASPEQVAQLERGLTRLAEVVARDLGVELREFPGGGAAGGMAAGAVAFFDAELVSGVEEVMRISELEERIQEADWVLTGEGRVDSQSLDGKVLSGVLQAAKSSGAQVAVIAGACQLSDQDIKSAGLKVALAANEQNLPLDEAMARAAELAEAAGARFAREQLMA
ncbi:glycerate kinase [Kiritimatiellota bacterium B12222]|nr:glycerate kinase [Kiritimatiellota bacterium B12222]